MKRILSLCLFAFIQVASAQVTAWVTPNPVDFGNVPIGFEQTKSVLLANMSGSTANFTGTLDSGTAGAFTLTCASTLYVINCAINIPPNNNVLIATVKFKPTFDGGQGTAFYIRNHNASNYPDTIIINVTGNGTVPIQLSSLTAEAQNNRVSIQWTTISETNNYGFYVERRDPDDSTFVEVAHSFMPGAGTTLEQQNYSFIDSTVRYTGIYYYRLRQVDLDASVHYSSVVVVNVSITGMNEHSAY